MTRTDMLRVERYLREKFGNNAISLLQRKDGSCEVSLGEEFIGVVYRDEDEGEISYDFNMAILEVDLPPVTSMPR